MRRLALLAALLLAGTSAAAHEEVPDERDQVVVTVRGHAETIGSSVVIHYLVRGTAETAVEAEESYGKRVRKILRNFAEIEPVTTRVAVEALADERAKAAGWVYNMTPNSNMAREPGATFCGRVTVKIRNLDAVSPRTARKRISQVLEALAENDLTGAEDDADMLSGHVEVDRPELRRRAYEAALAEARRRASVLAASSGRRLGRVSHVRELAAVTNADQPNTVANYMDIVRPGRAEGWTVSTKVTMDVDLMVVFELE